MGRLLSSAADLQDHVFGLDRRVVVAFVLQRDLAELDGLLRAPLETAEAVLAVSVPGGDAVHHDDVGVRADPFAESAGVAFVRDPEITVVVREERDRLLRHGIAEDVVQAVLDLKDAIMRLGGGVKLSRM